MLTDYFSGKSILLTGATGFLGKVILEKILRTFPNINCIYLSIKCNGSNSEDQAYDRYKNEIKDSCIFDSLRVELGNKSFRMLLKNKVRIIPMDLSK